MRIGMLGTGIVGRTLGSGLIGAGHEVTMGSRSATNPMAMEWMAGHETGAGVGTFEQAAANAEAVINATGGGVTLEALRAAGAANLAGKLLIDVSNPLDFSKGFPPSLTVSNTDSLGEQVQAAFPEARVVKSLNTISCDVMVNPGMLVQPTSLFVCGNDVAAKQETRELLGTLGWAPESVIDLGDITTSRGTEMYLPLWVRLMGALGTPHFNIAIVHQA
jgi:predicted dinucleotide-binding enzyme